MLMWPAVGSLEHCYHRKDAHAHAHAHTYTYSFTPTRPFQQQLYLDLLCECVQCSMFMDVVQMVTSHCQAQCLPSPPVPWLGSSGTSCRLLRHGGREREREQVRTHTCTCMIRADAQRYVRTHTHTNLCATAYISVNLDISLGYECMWADAQRYN